MRIVYFGTPDFAIPPLKLLHQSTHEIISIVTSPDKKSGRGLNVRKSPVKKQGEKFSIPVLQPNDFNDDEFISNLRKVKADIFIVVAFKKLPSQIFTMPKHGSINLHASLLPKYRGAAPIFHALLNGEKETGITTFVINEKIDEGMILLQEKIHVSENANSADLHDALSHEGARLLLETINKIEADDINPIKQKNDFFSKAPKIKKTDCKIDWNKKSVDIHNLIRALSPSPGAFTFLEQKRMKIFSTRMDIIDIHKELSPGEICYFNSNLLVGTVDGFIIVDEIQLEGKGKMNVNDFYPGHQYINGMTFA